MIHVPTAAWAHPVFDTLAWSLGGASGYGAWRWRLKDQARRIASVADGGYFTALLVGTVPGAFLAGSLNTWRVSTAALAHSIVGALVGAIVGVEVYKALRGVKTSTGVLFVTSFAVGCTVGRWGCLFTGLTDYTYGVPTASPWAVDLGDGVGRHPVQVYESLSMLVFLLVWLAGLAVRAPWAMRRGFYALCVWYGLQRFAWEFLKPYPPVLGPLNLFHLLCGALVVYGVVYFLADRGRERAGHA